MPTPWIIPIQSLDDPRIAPYTRLKDRDLARESECFIAEGELVVRRLLASPFPVRSLLLADRRAAAIAPLAPPQTPIYVAPADLVNRIVGFKFHSGVLAIGARRPSPSLVELAADWTDQPRTVLVLPEISKTDNLGSLIRIAAGFGVSLVMLGERCCDPFYRQAIRVSMGAVFRLPILRCVNLTSDLMLLRDSLSTELAAAVVAPDAQPLAAAARPRRLAILLGNETTGLAPDHLALCQRKITIPMQLGTDSLNVAVAAAVMLYHFTQVAGR